MTLFLNYEHREVCDAKGALRVAATELGACTAFLSSPHAFRVVKVSADGSVQHPDGNSLDHVFAVRAFAGATIDQPAEVRWSAGNDGTAAPLVVTIGNVSNGRSVGLLDDTISHEYMIGRTAAAVDDGWPTISPYQSIVPVPFTDSDSGQLRLRTAEYLSREGSADGNTFVVDEIVLGFMKETRGE